MNQNNAHLYLPLVQALADGELQMRCPCRGTWHDHDPTDCGFSFPPEHYRRKPKPRVYWLGFDAGGLVARAFAVEADALTWACQPAGRSVVKFVEDIDSGKKGG